MWTNRWSCHPTCAPLTLNTLTFALFNLSTLGDTNMILLILPSGPHPFPGQRLQCKEKKPADICVQCLSPHGQGQSNSLCLLFPQCWCWGHYSSKSRDRSRSVWYVVGPSGAPQPHHLRAPVCTGVSCAAATLNGTWPSTAAGCFSIISTQMWMSSYLHFPLISELERGRLVTTQDFPQGTRQC